MNNARYYNEQFARVAKITGLKFEKINPFDTIADGEEKEKRNLDKLEVYLKEKEATDVV